PTVSWPLNPAAGVYRAPSSVPWAGLSTTRTVSARPAGSVHTGAGRSIGCPDCVVALTGAAQVGAATDTQETVTPAVHGCQAGSPSAPVITVRAPMRNSAVGCSRA